MIELTTGIVFLLSSMYGAGSISADAVNVQPLTANLMDRTPYIIASNNKEALEKYLRENFADTPILLEIARCESELRQFDNNGQLVRGRVDNADVGVMQINERYHLETATKLGYNIHTVEGNVAYAKYLYGKFGSKPWNASSPCWERATVAMK